MRRLVGKPRDPLDPGEREGSLDVAGGGRTIGVLERRGLEHRGPEPMLGPTLDEDLAPRVLDQHGRSVQPTDGGAGLGRGDRFGQPSLVGQAGAGQGADSARRVARRADRRAQFHQSLVERASTPDRASVGDQFARTLPEPVPGCLVRWRCRAGIEAQEDARDIAIDDRLGLTKDHRGDRSSGVSTHARERPQIARVRRHAGIKPLDDHPGRPMERTRPAVVPKPRPRSKHLMLIGTGQGLNSWESGQERAEVLQDTRDLGLLEHDLADERGVGVTLTLDIGAPPGQIAGDAIEPICQRAGKSAIGDCGVLAGGGHGAMLSDQQRTAGG